MPPSPRTVDEHLGQTVSLTIMIPEAFEQTHDLAGLITVTGFLAAFILSKLGG